MRQLVVPRRRHSRLPAWARWLVALAAAVAIASNTVILLSDRAPGLLRRLSDRLEIETLRTAAVQVAPGEVPRSDFVVHVALWAVATALVGLAMGATWSRAVAAGGVLLYSAVVEVAQGALTYTRTPQAADMVANAVGVGVGLAVAVAVGLVLWCLPPRPT